MSTVRCASALRGRERKRHQQRGRELARHVAAHRHPIRHSRRADAARLDAERGKAGVAEIADSGAQHAQRIDEIADGTLVHAGDAGDFVAASGQREDRRQRPQRRAGVAEKEPGGLDRDDAPLPVHDEVARGADALDLDTQRLQRVLHPVDVVGVEQPLELRVPGGKRGQQQRAIGDALRPRQGERRLRRATSARGRGRRRGPRRSRSSRGGP